MPVIEPFPFVSVSGRPFERGRAYGRIARERVHRSAALYGGQLDELGLSAGARTRLIGDFAEKVEAFDASYLQEMQGIAEGAGVSLEQVVMINARTEVVAMARVLADRPEDGDEEEDTKADGCTGAIILPERSADGNLLHGQNWDWRPECVDNAVVLRIYRDDGPDVLTFVEAGGLGRHGMNAAGIAISGNYLRCDRDYAQPGGVPLALVRRKAMDQEHVALSMRVIATTRKACATNMLVSHKAGWAIDFECAPDEAFPLYPENGLIVHANHWVSQTALMKLRDTGTATAPDSLYRDWRVRRLLEEKASGITMADLKAALFDDFLSPYSVCRPPRPGLRGDITASVAMILMEPAAGIMEVAPLPALNRHFTRYSLTDQPRMLEAAE
ncbi:MAG TPA: C45 family peptidase [Microvirga sp.]|nr:C45 family peptidase [Microvirga sp.]